MRPWRALHPRALSLALVLACTPQEPLGGTTAGTSTAATTGDATTGDATTGDATAQPTSGDTSTTVVEPACECHDDCPENLFCYPDGSCNIDPSDCGEAVVNIDILAADVVLVLDKSTSMGTLLWDGDGDPQTPAVSRWRSLHGAVAQVVGARERSLHFGALLSPSKLAISEYSLAACPVEASPEVPVAPMNAAPLLAALPPPDAQGPALTGATPTRAALSAAFAHLDAQVDGLPHAVVLVTEGAANCSPDAIDDAALFEVYDEAVVQLVANANAAGVTTFVVGLAVVDVLSPNAKDGQPDATNLFDRLNELALAGGAPQDDPDLRFLAADDQPDIEAALTTIADALSPCVFPLDPIPKYPNYIDLRVDGVDYGRATDVADCTGVDGWRYVDAGAGLVELCGQACAGFRTAGAATFIFRCLPPPEPPQCPSP